MTSTDLQPATPAAAAHEAPATPRQARETARAQNLTLLVLLAGIFMTTLDIFIVNVAIPATQRDLHASRPRSSGSSPATASRSPPA